MRKTARDIPDFIFNASREPDAAYNVVTNRIRMDGIKNNIFTEDDIVLLLNHEIEHWAHFMFLTIDEVWDVLDNSLYVSCGTGKQNIFIERINQWNTEKLSEKVYEYVE